MGQTEQVASPLSQLRAETDLVSRSLRSVQNTKQWTMSGNPAVMLSVIYHRWKSLKNTRTVGLIIFHLYYRIITIHRWENTICTVCCTIAMAPHACSTCEAVYIFNIKYCNSLYSQKMEVTDISCVVYYVYFEQRTNFNEYLILMYCHQCVDNKCIRSLQPSIRCICSYILYYSASYMKEIRIMF
jgi:hypothetical protein